MKKIYIQPNSQILFTRLLVNINDGSPTDTLDPNKDNQEITPTEDLYNDEFGSKSRGSWSEEGLW